MVCLDMVDKKEGRQKSSRLDAQIGVIELPQRTSSRQRLERPSKSLMMCDDHVRPMNDF